jgi:7-cyano-7-deazaguanine synthase
MSKALVVFSGGQDSTTCLYYAREHYEEVFALTFNYGQRHVLELESARKIAQLAAVAHEIIEMGPLFAGLSPLTNHAIDVPAYEEVEAVPEGIADTFVPGRNILFLTIAANRAYVLGADTLVLGVAQQDFGGYPDCRLDFIEKMEAALVSGLEFPLKIVTPLMHLTKEETVKMAQVLPGCLEALAYSTTCYNGCFPPCGTCNSCLLRKKGFTQAGVEDPLLQRFRAGGMA